MMTEEKNIFDSVERNNEYKEIIKLSKIKKTLMSCIDMELVIEEAKKIIDKSKNFSFRSDRAKRFIDPKDPTFILKSSLLSDDKKSKENLQKLKGKELSDLTDKITHAVNVEVASKITEFITKSALDEEKFNELFKDLPEEFTNTFLTNIFIVRLSVVDNSVVLKIFS